MADAAAEAVTSDSGLLDWLTGGSTTSSIALLLCVLFGAYAAYIITNEPQRDGTHAPAQEDDDEEPPRDFTPKQLRGIRRQGRGHATLCMCQGRRF